MGGGPRLTPVVEFLGDILVGLAEEHCGYGIQDGGEVRDEETAPEGPLEWRRQFGGRGYPLGGHN